MAIVIVKFVDSSLDQPLAYTGFPISSETFLWQNVDEGSSTPDDDLSYVESIVKLEPLTLRSDGPILDSKLALGIRAIIRWKTIGAGNGELNLVVGYKSSQAPFDDTVIFPAVSSSGSGYLTFFIGLGPQIPNRRLPIRLTEAELLSGMFAKLSDAGGSGLTNRITAIELELLTGFEEFGSGGCKLGGIADEGFPPLKRHILKPVETISQANLFGSPEADPDLFHLNVDDDILNCPEDGFALPQAQSRLYTAAPFFGKRVKFRFGEFPVLEEEETIVGIVCSGCGQSDGHLNIDAELFITHADEPSSERLKSVIDLLGFIPGQGIKTSLNFDFFDPDVDGKNALHQALLDERIKPHLVDWDETYIQFSQKRAGVYFSFFWFSAIVWVGLLDPIASGGMKAGGVAKSGVSIPISGGATAGGEASVNGSTTEQGSGDFVKFFPPLKPDTSFFLSGGSNGDPLLSLGGERSLAEVESDLFDDFKPEETSTGLEDYRCIYVVNDLSNTLKDIRIWVEVNPLSDTVTTFGIYEKDDVQEVTLEFFTGAGSFILDFDGYDVEVKASPDLDTFAQNFQNSLRSSTPLTDVKVRTRLFDDTVTFVVTFTGSDGNKEQPGFALKLNDLVGKPSINIEKTIIGSPTNATAEIITTDITVPINPKFFETTRVSPIVVPLLNPNEGFPLWIRRTILPNPIATQNDGFVLKVLTTIA